MSETTLTAYAITRAVPGGFDEVVGRVTAALAREGFGVLTTIDVKATLKAKLDVDVEPHVILGACNPTLASQGLALEPDLGVLLPCNVVVRFGESGVHVAAMDPTAALALTGNSRLESLAREARERIQRAIESL